MIDCGEGTQVQLRHAHISFTKIRAVFISHLHGDHCFGLIGMISTFGMLGRTNDLHVYAPQALQPLLDAQLELFCTGLGFKVIFHEVDTTRQAVIYEDRSLTVGRHPIGSQLDVVDLRDGYFITINHVAEDVSRRLLFLEKEA